ncbi:MAG: hypothetical protein HKN82_07350 [Akkermansiaceae bacterium]|nr:hypothetical protein [Akkermansiaceae bacterium]
MKTVLACLLLASGSGAALAAADWHTDLKAALRKAAAEKKPLLMNFAQSDWSSGSIKLDDEVFHTKEFRDAAAGKFVLLEIDFPEDSSALPAKVRKQNAQLRERYGVTEFPTVFLSDAEGRPYARTGYRPGGAAAFLEHLDSLEANRARRDQAFAAAEQAAGAARAKALEAALRTVPEESVLTTYSDMAADLAKVDPDSKFLAEVRDNRRQARLAATFRPYRQKADYAGLIARIDSLLAKEKPAGEERQRLLTFRLNAEMENRRYPAARATAQAIEAIDPKTPFGRRASASRAAIDQLLKRQSGNARPAPPKPPVTPAPQGSVRPPAKKPAAAASGGKRPGPPKDEPKARGNRAGNAALGGLNDLQLRRNLEMVRRESGIKSGQLDEQHQRWAELDRKLNAARGRLDGAGAGRERVRRQIKNLEDTIKNLQADHDRTHATAEALEEAVAAHERELRRRTELGRLQHEARELQKRLEAVQERVEALKAP